LLVPPLTYHLVPRTDWAAADPTQPYQPSAFAREGFVHCTDGAEEVANTANRYFSAFEGDLLALVIDRARLASPVRYEDPAQVYPHIYGPIERDAIVHVVTMPRAPDGDFLPPA
jgi:uncharacterized protein (DUF952 family)